jgi:hypothetical protein
MKIEKRIVIFPQKFKSVTLSVSDVESFKDADEVLIHEVSRYLDLLEPEDIEILKRTIGLVVVRNG